jgi:hypothetical protein
MVLIVHRCALHCTTSPIRPGSRSSKKPECTDAMCLNPGMVVVVRQKTGMVVVVRQKRCAIMDRNRLFQQHNGSLALMGGQSRGAHKTHATGLSAGPAIAGTGKD